MKWIHFLVAAVGAVGCGPPDDNGTGWTVEIGYPGAVPFRPIADGDPVAVIVGPQGADMVQVKIRVDVGAGGSQPASTVAMSTAGSIGGVVVAGWHAASVDWTPDVPCSALDASVVDGGAGCVDDRLSSQRFVVDFFRVVFTAERCCFLCLPSGDIQVQLGLAKSAKKPVLFRLSTCPEPTACCWPTAASCCDPDPRNCPTVGSCPVPSLATVCTAEHQACADGGAGD